jgi:hypothetical protein
MLGLVTQCGLVCRWRRFGGRYFHFFFQNGLSDDINYFTSFQTNFKRIYNTIKLKAPLHTWMFEAQCRDVYAYEESRSNTELAGLSYEVNPPPYKSPCIHVATEYMAVCVYLLSASSPPPSSNSSTFIWPANTGRQANSFYPFFALFLSHLCFNARCRQVKYWHNSRLVWNRANSLGPACCYWEV